MSGDREHAETGVPIPARASPGRPTGRGPKAVFLQVGPPNPWRARRKRVGEATARQLRSQVWSDPACSPPAPPRAGRPRGLERRGGTGRRWGLFSASSCTWGGSCQGGAGEGSSLHPRHPARGRYRARPPGHQGAKCQGFLKPQGSLFSSRGTPEPGTTSGCSLGLCPEPRSVLAGWGAETPAGPAER